MRNKYIIIIIIIIGQDGDTAHFLRGSYDTA